MAADAVVYEGVLELGKEATAASMSSRDWKARLFVLRRDPVSNITCLSCYKDTKKRWQKQTPKAVLQLHPTFEVSLAHTSGFKYPLRLTVADRPPLFLAANSFHIMNQWIYHLQTQRHLVEKFGTCIFPVKAQDDSHTHVIGARGDLLLAITTESEILCALPSTQQVVGVWPFNRLRRYWCGEGVFGFEAGKKSPRGEGTYTFLSEQDEEIYTVLKRYIDKGLATRTTLQWNVTGVDVRPKYPLPPETTPPPSDEEQLQEEPGELSYEQIPAQNDLVGLPPSVSPYQRRKSSLHMHTEVSGPSPVYMLKRTQTAKPRQIQQWVDTTEAAGLSGVRGGGGAEGEGAVGGDAPPPVHPRLDRESLTLAEEDMYSHTQHMLPAPFQRRATDHNIVEESTYHTLVHDKCSTPKSKRESPPGNGRGGDREGEGEEASLYSIAYPPNVAMAEGRQVHAPAGSESEYGTLDRDAIQTVNTSGPVRGRTLSNLPLAPAKTAVGRVETEPSVKTSAAESAAIANGPSTPDTGGKDFEDSMTVNFLYDSHTNVVVATKGCDGEREAGRAPLDAREGSGGGERASVEDTDGGQGTEGGGGEIEGGGEGRGEGDGEKGEKEEGVRREEEGGRESGGEDKNKEGVEREREETAKDVSEEGNEIQRDAKGYTKINKKKKRNKTDNVARLDSEEPPPPPIPPRLYEGAENDVGLHGHDNDIDTDSLPSVATSDGVAVSDV